MALSVTNKVFASRGANFTRMSTNANVTRATLATTASTSGVIVTLYAIMAARARMYSFLVQTMHDTYLRILDYMQSILVHTCNGFMNQYNHRQNSHYVTSKSIIKKK